MPKAMSNNRLTGHSRGRAGLPTAEQHHAESRQGEWIRQTSRAQTEHGEAQQRRAGDESDRPFAARAAKHRAPSAIDTATVNDVPNKIANACEAPPE